MNPKCPNCGKETLRASINAFYINVPLHKDGYDHQEGKLQEDDIVTIECSECGTVVPISHYYSD